jgi:alkyl hydroperoxide reductase subunit AhpF
LAQQYSVDKAPGIVIAAQDGNTTTDYGIRYAGIPAGHEFSALINDLLLVSGRDSRLSESTRAALKDITQREVLRATAERFTPWSARKV